MTQAEINVKRARLLELAKEKVAAINRKNLANTACEAAQKHFYKCQEDVWTICEERGDLLDSLAAYKVDTAI